MDDDKKNKGGRTLEEWMRTPQRKAEEGITERQYYYDLTYSHPPLPLMIHFEDLFFANRHLSRSLLFRLAVHTLLFCASVMLSGSLWS